MQSVSIFYLLFFLSGLCALIYEIVWTRRLTLIFGITVYSISTVLAAFMGGLACGSLLFGRMIDRRKDPLRVYALLEMGIAVSAIALPFALAALQPAYRFMYDKVGASNYILSLAKFVLTSAVLIVPTTLMGATLPVLSRFIVRRSDRTGAGVGSLYAINTFGAVAGCFLAGFVLIGWIGMRRSEYFAVSLNILVGLVAYGLHRRLDGTLPNSAEGAEPQTTRKAEPHMPGTLRLVLFIVGLSGMAALAYEVLWTRILVFLLGSSIYSFSMILVVYLFGLTVGSLICARIVDAMRRPLYVFGWVEILIGLTVLAGLVLFRWLPFLPFSLKVSVSVYLARNFLSTMLVVLPPTLLMGATFPLAVKIYARGLGAIGGQTGVVYAVNTIGAIVGSFVAGFILIPLMGSKNSILLLVLISMACGFMLLHAAMKEEGAPALNWAAVVFFVVPVLGFPFGNDLMKQLSVTLLEERTGRMWRVIGFEEDATATVAVAEDLSGTRLLTVNGVSMTYLNLETQLMAHLPLAMMEKPENVLVICFGMGTTFVSARSAGMAVDFVELCPFVVEAFKFYHEDPVQLTEPGVGAIIADGRNYLLVTDKTYDVITIDPPPPPYSAGTVNLYTKEFYELCKARLTPQGIVCQWIPMHSSTEEQYKMLLRTFLEVFPHTTVWGSINNMGTYLIGTPDRLKIDQDSFSAYFQAPAVVEDLSLYTEEAVDGPRLLSLLLLSEDGVRYYVQNTPIISDDLPFIEFPLLRPERHGELMRTSFIYGGRG